MTLKLPTNTQSFKCPFHQTGKENSSISSENMGDSMAEQSLSEMAGSIAGTETMKGPRGRTLHSRRGNGTSFLLHTNS